MGLTCRYLATYTRIFIMELKYVNVNVSSLDDSDPELLIVM